SEWNFWLPRLSNTKLKPSKADILENVSYMHRILKVRKSSPLFRLSTEKSVMDNVTFLSHEEFDKNQSKFVNSEIPGLIAMNITDKDNIDPQRKSLLVLFNSSTESVDFTNRSLKDKNMQMHNALTEPIILNINNENISFPADPQLKKSVYNKSLGSVTVPPRTTVVYQELK
ncbi:MAG: alpha-1,6-glucosidase domain-containing protein, partial [Bacteroidia bacterium]